MAGKVNAAELMSFVNLELAQGKRESAVTKSLVARGVPEATAERLVEAARANLRGPRAPSPAKPILIGIGLIGLAIGLAVWTGNRVFVGLLAYGGFSLFMGVAQLARGKQYNDEATSPLTKVLLAIGCVGFMGSLLWISLTVISPGR